MYIATSKQLKRYDQALLDYGYSIEELVDKASDCLIKHFHHYRKVMIVCGPGNNGADGISLGIKLLRKEKKFYFVIADFLKSYHRQIIIMFNRQII